MLPCFVKSARNAVPIKAIPFNSFSDWLKGQDSTLKTWVKTLNFNAKPGTVAMIPGLKALDQVLVGTSSDQDFWFSGNLPNVLPPGNYFFDEGNFERSLAWALGSYRFCRYRNMELPQAKLALNVNEEKKLLSLVDAIYHIRDLVNTSAEDLSPRKLVEFGVKLAKKYGAKSQVIAGDLLLKKGYPTVHMVGRASTREPCVLDFTWGNPKHKKITLVGKGICFDSGGLNIKDCINMRLMKKDMGGAAHALGLAQLIMEMKLPIYLRVIIPAADNVISGNSFRQGDVITTRSGKTVEIANTDAEGRLVLCDALTAAVEENPEQIIDFATLTGAARAALGPQIPAFFCNNDAMAQQILTISKKVQDPIWQLPLFQPYRDYLKSEIADISNCNTTDAFAGAITASLYLQTFVPESVKWAHFDLSAWNFTPLPGRPVGGEAMAIRAVFDYLKNG